MSNFEENLNAFALLHPINIDLIKNAKLEHEEEFETFEPIDFDDIAPYEGLFVYGLKKGKWIESLSLWLDADPKRRLIVCESDPAVYKSFLSSTIAERLIHKKNLHFILAPTGLNPAQTMLIKDIVKVLICIFHLHRVSFLEHPMQEDTTKDRKKNYEDAIQKGLSDYHYYDQILHGQQHKTFINTFENLSIHQDMQLISQFKDAFKGVPIVLCGAGFSLPKVYDKLQSIQSHTLIAAAGTASSLLFSHHIYSHFSAILDVAPGELYTPLYHNNCGVLFYLLRSGCSSVQAHQGFKVVCDSHQEFPALQELLKDKLNIDKQSFPAWTVTDFLLQQLIYMGFGPIYLCGTDHILDKDQYYGEKLFPGSQSFEPFCKGVNIKGEKVFTKFDWQQGSKNISKIAESHKETSVIYVTDEGLSLDHVTIMSTAEFNSLDFDNSTLAEDLYLDTFLKAKSSSLAIDELINFTQEMKASLERCQEIFHKINIELGKTYSAWQIIPIDSLNPYLGVFFELQKQLQEEKAYNLYLEPTWSIFKRQLHSEAGFFGEGTKAKLTLFALKTRELDFMIHQAVSFLALLNLQNQQFEERAKKQLQEITS